MEPKKIQLQVAEFVGKKKVGTWCTSVCCYCLILFYCKRE